MFDAHIHLDELKHTQFGDGVWASPRYRAIVPGVTPAQTLQTIDHFSGDPRILVAAAIHPWWVLELDADVHPDTCPEFRAVSGLARRQQIAAVGESGLDHIKCPPTSHRYQQQLHYFRAHAALALSENKPLIVHAVRCHSVVREIIAPYVRQGLAVMIHAYAGSAEETRAYARLGCRMSIGPPVTRESSRRVRSAAADIPDELLLIETDAPAMAAGVKRARGQGRVDDIREVAAHVATLRGVAVDDLQALTERNARLLFNVIE